MKQDKPFAEFRRVLVPLDASEHSLGVLKAAVELAAAQEAELEGLFVEDADLFRLCEFPMAREVSFWGTLGRSLKRSETERQMRIAASRLKRTLEDMAGGYNVPCKFRVMRGGVSKKVLDASNEADLTIMGRIGWSKHLGRRMGTTAQALVRQGRGLILLMDKEARFQPPLQVLYTGSSLSEATLLLALELSRKRGFSLVILMAANAPATLEDMQDRVQSIVSRQGASAGFYLLRELDSQGIKKAVAAHGTGTLFLPCEDPCLYGDSLQHLINSLDNSVFLVREK
ncbi:universal stress protein [Desulfonatronospira sp.]|uniref:universal stress protein n=1 Tax=Desulfonatronospira sp. TaxID=1962951 RepID=UPI0025BA93AB|nr:universal stress protein [Desulfonatronospira sp.]